MVSVFIGLFLILLAHAKDGQLQQKPSKLDDRSHAPEKMKIPLEKRHLQRFDGEFDIFHNVRLFGSELEDGYYYDDIEFA